MRREKEGEKSLVAALAAAFLFLACSVSGAQNFKQPSINDLKEKELDSLHLLTRFQIKSLLDYRERWGDIMSATELTLVDGFTEDDVEALEGLISFEPSTGRGRISHLASVRAKKNWKKDGFSITTKYKLSGNVYEGAFTLDNDPGERFPDYFSGYARYKGLIVGDYDLRFGQGLVMSTGLAVSAFGEPAAQFKSESFRGHTSSEECNFLRGAAWSGRLGRLDITTFLSCNGVDARIVDGSYTSIAADGLHATESERAKKHSMREPLGGFSLARNFGSWRVSATAVGYSYTKPNGRKVQNYNRGQIYNGFWGNVSVSVYGIAGSWRIFAEAATDMNFAPALKASALWAPSYNLEMSLSARVCSPSYIASHSAGSANNQIGAEYALRYIAGNWKFNVNLDYCYYPWYRFQKPAGTMTFKARAVALRTWKSGAMLQAQLSYNEMPKGRISVKFPIGPFQLGLRAEGNPKGFAAFAEASLRTGRFEASARVTYYNTDGWDGRIYLYETGVPQSFSTQAYYGKGIGEYLVLKYSPMRKIDLWLKVQQGYCAFFTRIFIPG